MQNKSQEEFISLYSVHSLRIRGFIHSLIPGDSDTDDVVQEVSRKLWQQFESFDPKGDSAKSFLNWALTIARYEVMTYRRNIGRSKLILSSECLEVLAQGWDLDEEVVSRELSALKNCMEKLNFRVRRAVELKYQLGMQTPEIALALGQGVDGIYKMLQRAQRTLAECVVRQMRIQEM